MISVPRILPIIDGEDLEDCGDGLFDVVSPATGQVIAQAATCNADAVARIVRSSQNAFEQSSWQTMSAADRGLLLLRLADLLEAHAERLVELELRDTGKPITQLQTGELPLAVAIVRFYAGAADKVDGAIKPGATDDLLLQLYEPYGVVAGILPWNYPLVNAALKVAPAVAAGNAIVLKPAQETPLSTVAFAKLCMEAGLPPGLVNVVLGSGSQAGQELVDHPLVQKISFTGSTAVGQHIQSCAASQMKKVNLECGGKNALIVFADADLDRAAEAALLSGFVNTGQLCVSCSRLLIEQSVAADFEDRLLRRAAKIKVGDPQDPETLVGPMISRNQYNIVKRYLADAAGEGRRILCGGGVPNMADDFTEGFWLEPTIVSGVRPGMTIHDEEIFGPVLSLVTFASEADAVNVANSVGYGLSGSVWTKDGAKALRVSRSLDTGIVWVNTMLAGYPQISLSPHKLSGTGVELGMEGLKAYLRQKSIVVGTNDNAPMGWGLGS